MVEGKGAQKQQMGSWGTQSWDLSNPDEKLSAINPPPIIGSSSNTNDPLISNQNQQVVDEGVNAEADKMAPSRTSHGARKRTTCKTTAGVGGRNGNGVGGGGGEDAGDHDMHIWTERERRRKMRKMFSDLHALLPQLPPKADKSSIVDEAVRYIKTLEITLENLEKIKQERLKQVKKSADSTTTILCDPSQRHRSETSREDFMADHSGSSIHNSSTYKNNNLASATNAMNITIGASTSLSLTGGIVNKPSAGFQTWSSSNVVVNICGDQAHINLCSLKKPDLFTSICTVFEKYKIEVLSAHISSDDHRCFYMIHAQQMEVQISLERQFQQRTLSGKQLEK